MTRMTRKEAWNEIDAIIGKHEIDDEYVTITREQGYEALRVAREALEQQTEDAISRQAVLDLCDSKDPEYKVEHLKEDVDCLPSVTPQPKTGHWYRKHRWEIYFTCSNCETTNASGTKYNYCPSCGAKMVEPQESEDKGMTWTITKTCGSCEHYPNDKHCIGCVWDEDKGENTKWELKKNPIVIERAVLDKIRAEIEDTLYVDSLIFGELIDFKNGKISADDVIEEFNRVTRIEVLKIIDKYKAESEKE